MPPPLALDWFLTFVMPASDSPRLLVEERRREIVRLLEDKGRVTVADLSTRFQVSAVTVRDDLDALSAADVLVRSCGGAIRPLSPAQDYPLHFRKSVHQAEKSRIASAAAGLIQPHQTVQELLADHFFLAVDGLHLEIGLSTPDVFEAQLNSRMMKISREVTVIADSSKFGRHSVARIGDLSRALASSRTTACSIPPRKHCAATACR